ncbi:hypothetical protein B0T22DRAFT_254684 [Podospora appendiculata]|uniref:Uncharacterized protein n=1 Tax=Podospora appendiculata TaxID=314037 RepID=A0AAE0X2K2_9PEZI|nr:hypothetical protein B0T22DRAFT_254684 [Podospora appendiculata]
MQVHSQIGYTVHCATGYQARHFIHCGGWWWWWSHSRLLHSTHDDHQHLMQLQRSLSQQLRESQQQPPFNALPGTVDWVPDTRIGIEHVLEKESRVLGPKPPAQRGHWLLATPRAPSRVIVSFQPEIGGTDLNQRSGPRGWERKKTPQPSGNCRLSSLAASRLVVFFFFLSLLFIVPLAWLGLLLERLLSPVHPPGLCGPPESVVFPIPSFAAVGNTENFGPRPPAIQRLLSR